MKKIIAYPLCQIFYYLGHFASKFLEMSIGEKHEWWCDFWYPIYSNLMGYSVYWNDYGGLKVWGKAE